MIDWDPWDAIEPEEMLDQDKVDPDLVMDPADVRRMGRACADIAPRYEAYVLIQGFCGLRPGEADQLRRRDVDLYSNPPTVTVRGSISRVSRQFFADDETRRRPLKRRGSKARRTIPIPDELVPAIRWHMDTFVGSRRDALVFTNTAELQINDSNFRLSGSVTWLAMGGA